jgi:hypothetical protein
VRYYACESLYNVAKVMSCHVCVRAVGGGELGKRPKGRDWREHYCSCSSEVSSSHPIPSHNVIHHPLPLPPLPLSQVARQDVLLHFNTVFEGLCKLFADGAASLVQRWCRVLPHIVSSCLVPMGMHGVPAVMFAMHAPIDEVDDRSPSHSSPSSPS